MIKEGIKKRETWVPASEIHVRAAGEDGEPSRRVEGYAILFDSESTPMYRDKEIEVVEVIDRGAVTQELLDGSDIKFTMFHNMERILGRSKRGRGTLSYEIDDRGVKFSVDLPRTADGDYCLEAVKRGDIDGCSFMFSTYYGKESHVTQERESKDGKTKVTCRVMKIEELFDMTVTPDPAYEMTEVEARGLGGAEMAEHGKAVALMERQLAEMRSKMREGIMN